MASRMTNEQWQEYVRAQTNGEYVCLSTYTNTRTKVRMRHVSEMCGNHEYDVAPTYFTQGVRCPKCANARKGKTREPVTLEQFYERLHAIYPEGEYAIVGKYVNISTVVEVRHRCGHVFRVVPSQLVSPTYRTGCKICQRASQVWTHERFLEEMRAAGDGADQYVALTEYTGYNDPILLRHVPSGAEWQTTPNTFLAGGARYDPNRSPRNSSHHREARRLLKAMREVFEEEKSFPDLRSPISGRPLWFDFWLPERSLLIELDGELHWTAYGSESGAKAEYIERRRILDDAKNKWAARKAGTLRLVRIDVGKGMDIPLQTLLRSALNA